MPGDDPFDLSFALASTPSVAPAGPAPGPPPVAPAQPNISPLSMVQTPGGPQPLPAPPPAATPPPWTPGGAIAKPIPGASEQLNAAINAATGTVEEQARLVAQRQAAQAPYINAELNLLNQPLPQHPQMQQPPPVPKREEILSGLEQWAMALATVAGVMGGRGRTHAGNALAAMTGAIEGLNEGNQQKFDQNMKIWDAENKRVQEINTQSRNEYVDTLNDRKLRAEEKNMQIQLIAQRYDDKAIASLGGDWQRIATMVQARDQLNQTAAEYERGLRGYGSRFGSAALRAPMTPETLDLRAAMQFVGNPLALRGISALSGQANDVFARLAAHENGTQPFPPELLARAREVTSAQLGYTGEQSYQRSAGTQAARVESASNEVVQLAPQALQTSEALPRGKFVPFNEIMQRGLKAFSDPAYNDFVTANLSLENAYTRAMNPTGVPRVADRHTTEQIGLLNTAVSPEAYRTQVLRMLKEVRASKRAVAETRAGGSGTEELDNLIDSIEATRPGTAITVHPDPAKIQRTQTGIQWSTQ